MKKIVLPLLVCGLFSVAVVGCTGSEKSQAESTDPIEKMEEKQPKPEVSFYPSGAIKTSGKYKGEERQGVWSSWFETGELRSEAYYQAGKRNGEYKVWYQNEQPQIEGYFSEDKPSGIWHLYDSTGTLVNKIEYKDGEPVKLPIK